MANNGYQPDDIRDRLREALCGMLIDRIGDDRYPSSTMMDMVERIMRDDQVGEYAEALFEKVSDDRYPSMDMMRRLIRLT